MMKTPTAAIHISYYLSLPDRDLKVKLVITSPLEIRDLALSVTVMMRVLWRNLHESVVARVPELQTGLFEILGQPVNVDI